MCVCLFTFQLLCTKHGTRHFLYDEVPDRLLGRRVASSHLCLAYTVLLLYQDHSILSPTYIYLTFLISTTVALVDVRLYFEFGVEGVRRSRVCADVTYGLHFELLFT